MNVPKCPKSEREVNEMETKTRRNVDLMYTLFFSVNRHCFNGELIMVPLYWISNEIETADAGLMGFFRSYPCQIYMKRLLFLPLGAAAVHIMHHEAAHLLAFQRGKKDMIERFHTSVFRDIVEENGGVCELGDYGWCESKVKTDLVCKILEEIGGK